MRVLVQTALGTSFELVAAPEDNVFLLKCKILHKLGIPVAQQHLMLNLVELTNSANLSSYSIKDGSVLKLLVSLKNGLIADCGRTISTLDHIQWTELKYFLENNREEAMEWLHAGYKGLVLDDEDDDFIAHFLMDTPQTLFLPGIPLTEEDCVTKCKMIDVQSKMRELSLKRFEKNFSYDDKRLLKEFHQSDCPCGEGNHAESILYGVNYRELHKKYNYKSSLEKLPQINRSHNSSSSLYPNESSSNLYDYDDNVENWSKIHHKDNQSNQTHTLESRLNLCKDTKDFNQKIGFLPPIDSKIKDKGRRNAGGKSERVRCLVCKKRLSIATIHNCPCGGVFCAPHRYSEVHNCQYDYSKEWLNQLKSANPPAYNFPKLPKI